MTKEQKELISELRREGLSYSAIAALVKLPVGTVTMHCKRHSLSAKDISYKSESASYSRCETCGDLIRQSPHRKAKRFCSDECRWTYWNMHRPMTDRYPCRTYRCPACGKKFTVYGNVHRTYCCHRCYIISRFGGENGV